MNPGGTKQAVGGGSASHPSRQARQRRLAARKVAREARVLVAECDPGARAAIGDSIRLMGYPVTTCATLEDALRESSVGGFEVLVAAVPKLDEERVRLLNLMCRVLPRSPLIVVTTDESLASRRRALELRAFYHAVRPLDRVELRAALAGAAERSRAIRV
jgi:DNA-binding NtrC family response regulator